MNKIVLILILIGFNSLSPLHAQFKIDIPEFKKSSEPQLIPLDRIVAVANQDVVTLSELETRIDELIQQLRQARRPMPPVNILRDQVLERLILKKLQMQMAESTGIKIDDDTLNRAIRRIAEGNNLSLSRFRKVLEEDGYSFTLFREDIREELIIRRLHERQINQRVIVSEQDIDQYLLNQANNEKTDEQYHLAHILISLPDAATPSQLETSRKKIDDILQKIKNGADFSEMAVSYSTGQHALEGGELGWRKSGELPTIFANIVPKMKINDVSDIIRSPNGFHLVKLLEKRGDNSNPIGQQTLARHILIATSKVFTSEQAHQKLIEIKKKIVDGGDFGKLAREFSDDLGSANKGGDLGWVKPGVMVPTFEAKMNELNVGEMGDPFNTQFGWHLIQVQDRKNYDATDDTKRREARLAIRQRKIEEETETWLRRLRDEAYVEYRLEGVLNESG